MSGQIEITSYTCVPGNCERVRHMLEEHIQEGTLIDLNGKLPVISKSEADRQTEAVISSSEPINCSFSGYVHAVVSPVAKNLGLTDSSGLLQHLQDDSIDQSQTFLEMTSDLPTTLVRGIKLLGKSAGLVGFLHEVGTAANEGLEGYIDHKGKCEYEDGPLSKIEAINTARDTVISTFTYRVRPEPPTTVQAAEGEPGGVTTKEPTPATSSDPLVDEAKNPNLLRADPPVATRAPPKEKLLDSSTFQAHAVIDPNVLKPKLSKLGADIKVGESIAVGTVIVPGKIKQSGVTVEAPLAKGVSTSVGLTPLKPKESSVSILTGESGITVPIADPTKSQISVPIYASKVGAVKVQIPVKKPLDSTLIAEAGIPSAIKLGGEIPIKHPENARLTIKVPTKTINQALPIEVCLPEHLTVLSISLKKLRHRIKSHLGMSSLRHRKKKKKAEKSERIESLLLLIENRVKDSVDVAFTPLLIAEMFTLRSSLCDLVVQVEQLTDLVPLETERSSMRLSLDSLEDHLKSLEESTNDFSDNIERFSNASSNFCDEINQELDSCLVESQRTTAILEEGNAVFDRTVMILEDLGEHKDQIAARIRNKVPEEMIRKLAEVLES